MGDLVTQTALQTEFDVTVVGGWFHGEFIAPVDHTKPLETHTVLLVTGTPENLTRLQRRTTDSARCERSVVVGYGIVGTTVAETLHSNDVDVTVVDLEHHDDIDVYGDITDLTTLKKANVSDADSIILALSRDSLPVYASLIIEDEVPRVEILSRADEIDYVQKCYDASVEYALALSEVTAHMVAKRLFGDDLDAESDHEYRIFRSRIPGLAGQRLDAVDIRRQTGVTVIAVERMERLVSNPGPEFEFSEKDTLILMASAQDATTFEQAYGIGQ